MTQVKQIEAAVARIRDDPKLVARYDVTGDGELDEQEWELVRRMVALELKTAAERQTTWDLDDEPDVLNDRFELIGLLGRGGQAYTHLARDLDHDGEHVVIKELNVRVAADWKSIELFEREAEVLERLTHPSIPRYVDAFHLDDAGDVRFMLVQQFVDGRDLGEFVEGGGRWDEAEAVRRLTELCDVLDYLHHKSPAVIHRDIKPSNLILGRDGRLYLVDFGAVQTVVPTTVGGSTIIGTSGYVPMEQYMGRAVPRSDIYALGATAVHLICGVHPADLPFEHGTLKVDEHLNVSYAFRQILQKMLQPTTERRFVSATELFEAVKPLWTRLEGRPKPKPEPEPEPAQVEPTIEPEVESEPEPEPASERPEVEPPSGALVQNAPLIPVAPSRRVLEIDRSNGLTIRTGSGWPGAVAFLVGCAGVAGLLSIPGGMLAVIFTMALGIPLALLIRVMGRSHLTIRGGECFVDGEGKWTFPATTATNVEITSRYIVIELRSGERVTLWVSTGHLAREEQLWVERLLRDTLRLPQKQLPE